jgi:hypothetical protein
MKQNNGEAPPLFGSWPKAYATALGIFAFEVALLYAFTVFYS